MAAVAAPQAQAPIALSRFLTEDTKKIHADRPIAPMFINAAYAIATLAAIAITGGILASYLGLLGASTMSGWVVLASLAGSSLLTAYVVMEIIPKAQKAEYIENNYKQFAEKLEQIGNWDEERIRGFFATNEINMDEYTPGYMDLLRAKEPNAPLKALLPLIARYLVAVDRAEEASQIATEEKAKLTDPKMNKDEYRKHAHLALSCKATAAFYLRCLQKPALAVPAVECKQSELLKIITKTPTAVDAELELLTSRYRPGADTRIFLLKKTLLAEKSERNQITDIGLLFLENRTPREFYTELFTMPEVMLIRA